jgi:hypothetical protein
MAVTCGSSEGGRVGVNSNEEDEVTREESPKEMRVNSNNSLPMHHTSRGVSYNRNTFFKQTEGKSAIAIALGKSD